MIPKEADQSVHGQEMRRCTEGSVENLATEGRKDGRRSPNQKTRRISHEWRRRIQAEDRRRNAEAAAPAPCASTRLNYHDRLGSSGGRRQSSAAEDQRTRRMSMTQTEECGRQKHVLLILQSGMEKRGTGVTEGKRRRRHAEGENAMHPSTSTDR